MTVINLLVLELTKYLSKITLKNFVNGQNLYLFSNHKKVFTGNPKNLEILYL